MMHPKDLVLDSQNCEGVRESGFDQYMSRLIGKNIFVDTDGPTWDISWYFKDYKELPYTFQEMKRSLNVNDLELRNLRGMPRTIPVDKTFSCANNLLTSLRHGPIHVGKYIANNNHILTFDGFPNYVDVSLDLSSNKIRSLCGIHKHLHYCKAINLTRNPIEEGGIGLLLIQNLRTIMYSEDRAFIDNPYKDYPNGTPPVHAFKIIRKYLGRGKEGLLECANELDDAGLGAWAKL